MRLTATDLAKEIQSKPFRAVPREFLVTQSHREVYQDGNYIVIMPQSMADVRCIEGCAKFCRGVEGDVAEAGVYFGATARLLARWFERTNKTIHLFDTFDIMPDADPKHDWPERWNPKKDLSLDRIKSFLSEFDNIRYYKGLFKDTLHEASDKKFCFVHIDCDLYAGAKDACEFFYPRLNSGGVMMFHDYDVPAFPGMRKAVEEFFIYKPDLRITNRYGGHHVVIKK